MSRSMLSLMPSLPWNAYRCKNFSLYRHLSLKVKNMLSKQKFLWAQRAKSTSKDLWKTVNVVRGTSSSRSTTLDSIIKLFPSLHDAAEDINSMFSSNQVQVPQNQTIEASYSKDDSITDDWRPIVEVNAVFDALSSLKCEKASGDDGVPNILYKRAAHILLSLIHI